MGEADGQPGRENWRQGSVWWTRLGEAVARGPGRVRWQIADWVVPHSHADKRGGTTGEPGRLQNPGL